MKMIALASFALVACGQKSDHAPAAGAVALAKVTDFKDRVCACKDKDCATKVHEAFTQWGVEVAKTIGNERPDEAMTKKMTEVAMAYGDCFSKAMNAVPIPSPPATEATGQQAEAIPFSGSTGIPECDDYKAAVDKLGACDKMPAASRSVMKEALGQALLSIKTLPADGKKEAATACVTGLDAMKEAAKAVGCDIVTK